MEFENIFNSYIKENNLNLKPLQENNSIYTKVLFESFLLEAKKAKSDLYKDLVISGQQAKVTAEDVASVKFYVKGKSAKDGKSPEESKKINEKQANLFNQIISKVKQDATDNKTTLIELTAAAFSVFKADGQNKPTCGYNLRGVLTVLISNKKFLTPSDGGSVNASSVVVDPGDGTVDNEVENAAEVETPSTETEPEAPLATKSKFDSALSDNQPVPDASADSSEESSGEYLQAEKNARVEKSELGSREDRIAANYILDTLKEELPGFFNKSSLFARTQEEDAGMTEQDVSKVIDKLIKLNKVKYVPKGTSEEGEVVPDREDEDSSEKETMNDPRDFIDKQISGSTRKGFSGGDFDYSGFDF
jgi:hypothetical protein